MSSRKWEGAKVCDGIAQEKFLNQQNLAAGGAKVEPEKFVHQRKNWAGRKKQEKAKVWQEVATNKIWHQDTKF